MRWSVRNVRVPRRGFSTFSVLSLLINFGLPVQAAAARFSTVEGGGSLTGVLITGPIIEGDAAHFDQSLASVRQQYPDHHLRAIALDSPGGLVGEAAKMATRIRNLGLVTVVPDDATCASACSVLFAAGSIKVASPTARLGVHGAANLNGEQDTMASAATTRIAQALGLLGAPASVIGRMVVTPPGGMTWLSPQEVEMFPLGFSLRIDKQLFPIILSEYDAMLDSQKKAGVPLSLGRWIPSQPMPDYQRAGPALPSLAPPSPYVLPTPPHSKELIAEARDYSAGYLFGVGKPNSVCQGSPAWIRGCQGGAYYRTRNYTPFTR